MTEWGLTPEYILDNWTEELFVLMFQKRTEAFMARHRAMTEPAQPQIRRMSDMEFFKATQGGNYQVVKVN